MGKLLVNFFRCTQCGYQITDYEFSQARFDYPCRCRKSCLSLYVSVVEDVKNVK